MRDTSFQVKPAAVLRAGDPRLRRVCSPVGDVQAVAFQYDLARLHATLRHFRAEHGFGRAIAAPQIGVQQRFIAMNLGSPLAVINPEITWASPETFTLWDDCLSFPDRLVRVQRHDAISVRFVDAEGRRHHWQRLDRATSELLQHEMDHLDGVLALDRALSPSDTISRRDYEAQPTLYARLVDYVI